MVDPDTDTPIYWLYYLKYENCSMFHLDNRLTIQLNLLNISLEMIPLFSSFFYMPTVHLCLKSTDFNASYLLNSSSSSISTTTLISDPHNFLVGLSWHSPDWSACPILLLAAVLCWVTLSCPTLCDPMDGSPPGSSIHVILQARILEWVAMPSTRGIFPTQGSNPGFPHCRQILHHPSHQNHN